MTRHGDQRLILAGDIGGTKTNLGLFRKGKRRPVVKVTRSYPSREAANLAQILEQFLARHPVTVAGACFGVAGPVRDGVSRTTNLPWDVSEKKLKNRFGWDSVRVINDLTATAYAVPLLTKRELFTLNPGRKYREKSVGLIAPGTGLGMALLIWKDGSYVSVPSEGGHIDFAPNNEAEAAFWKYLHVRLGHVSVERALSGPGLFIIYCWMKFTGQGSEPTWLAEKLNEGDPSKAITDAALEEKDPLCVKALDFFVSILGATAGNLALTGLTRGGIYLGGGIVPKILLKLQEELFMRAFVDKGRFRGLVSEIPVHVILNDKAALLGAAHGALMNLS
ncbi:MAG: glucokinase [Deltaproteobacteria bacterium]|nr:glucokinase [Deltaproteobacteria bacterium]MBW2170929.1 glucokinase [Deltaproteobacteria bacterium]MBW2259013.1 glucokinase [Deltaproteobacteria bacterium]